VHLSYTSGAPLIPVFTIRAEDGIYDVSIGPPLDILRAAEVPPDFKLDYEGIVRSYVKLLETHVLCNPDQYSDWESVRWEWGSSTVAPSVVLEDFSGLRNA
jgi:lauroyl/myristoyl acyltransferase